MNRWRQTIPLSIGFFALLFHLAGQQRTVPVPPDVDRSTTSRPASTDDDQTADAERELQTGIGLTRSGHFQEAIPHLKAAEGVAVETFAIEFNLGLCYLGTRQFHL